MIGERFSLFTFRYVDVWRWTWTISGSVSSPSSVNQMRLDNQSILFFARRDTSSGPDPDPETDPDPDPETDPDPDPGPDLASVAG